MLGIWQLGIVCMFFMHQAWAFGFLHDIKLNELAEPPSPPHRSRRGPPGHSSRMRPIPCCNTKPTEEQLEIFKRVHELKKECRGELNVEPKDRSPEKMRCVMNCVAKKFDVLDADNNFNEENFRNASKSVMPTEVQEFVDDAITKCIASEGPQTKEECDTYPIKLHMCARGGLVADCPAELKDTTDQCTDKLEVKDVPED